MPSAMDGAIRVFFDINDDKIGLYRSLKVTKETSFGELHEKVSEKIGISAKRSTYFQLVLRYESPVAHPRIDYCPEPHRLVMETIESAELNWIGDVALVYADVRPPSRRTPETATANSEVQRKASLSNMESSYRLPMTEFLYRQDGLEQLSMIVDSIATEVEDVCIKQGKLMKMQMGKDSSWRYSAVQCSRTLL